MKCIHHWHCAPRHKEYEEWSLSECQKCGKVKHFSNKPPEERTDPFADYKGGMTVEKFKGYWD